MTIKKSFSHFEHREKSHKKHKTRCTQTKEELAVSKHLIIQKSNSPVI